MGNELKANDLRVFAIQNRTEITYRVRSAGQVCVVSEQGLIKIPGLEGRPPYNAEAVLARADEFTLSGRDKKAHTLSREEMLALLQARAPGARAPQKEEE